MIMKAGEIPTEKPNLLVPEDEYWKGVRTSFGWNMFSPDIKVIWEVNIFDDGNVRMERVPNTWIIYGEWKDKVALLNTTNPNTRIPSISMWKIKQKITNF